MTPFYSHRLKTVLQHMVCDLGLTVSMEDGGARVSIAESRAMIEETAQRMGVSARFLTTDRGEAVIFEPGATR